MKYCLSCCALNDVKAKTCYQCSSSLELCPVDEYEEEYILNKRYKLIAPLSQGGMGELYSALDTRLNSICVVKELYLGIVTKEEKQYRIRRFKSEVEILAKLRHPSLPHVLDYFYEDDSYYLVMDYIAGDDLEGILEKEGRPGLDEKRVINWMLTVADVIEYLHNNKPQIIYRDLKPSNIMRQKRDGRIILIDFGTARTIDRKEKHQTAIGTMGYAPPEQYEGEPDTRSDIYSLGATMYHLVTGTLPRLPFEFKPIRKINSNLSEKLESILIKALEKEPDNRYHSIEVLKNELNSLISGKEIVITQEVHPREEEKEESWNLLGKIKRNILNSISKLKKDVMGRKTIKTFIIDSSSTQLLTYRKAIENSGEIEITGTALNVEEYIEKYSGSKDKVDAILIDVSKKTSNISRQINEIKKLNSSSKIILLSSNELDRETALTALRSGANGYIIKENTQSVIDGIKKAVKGGVAVEAEIVTMLLDEFITKTETPKDIISSGFDGLELEEVDLYDLLIEFCSCNVTGKMHVKSHFSDGDIFVEEGEITHCTYGDMTGEDAFRQSVNWYNGKGRFYGKEVSGKRTITTDTAKLLSEVITIKEKFAKIRTLVKLNDIFKIHITSSAFVTLKPEHIFILPHLDENKSIETIMKDTGKTYFDVANVIYDLYNSGMVRKDS